MKKLHLLVQIVLFILPWRLRRWCLTRFFGFRIAPTAHIGYSVLLVDKLELDENAYIGTLTLVKGLHLLRIGKYGRLGNMNWVTGFPKGGARFFQNQPDRAPELIIHDHAAIHHRNLIDCTDRITVGPFSRVAGWNHQFLTHSIDFSTANQSSAPITIGKHCFVATGAVLLKGSCLPDYSVLGACSVLHKAYEETGKLYSGVPAMPVRDLDLTQKFFCDRPRGDSDLPQEVAGSTTP